MIYSLLCPCALLYIGRTSQPMRTRTGEHRSSITTEKENYAVIVCYDVITNDLDSGKKHQILCTRETVCIFTLGKWFSTFLVP